MLGGTWIENQEGQLGEIIELSQRGSKGDRRRSLFERKNNVLELWK